MEGVRKLVPALDPRQAISQYAGLRPVRDPDGYHIRAFDHLPGYLEISGIRSTGVSASLALARYATHRLTEMGLNLPPRSAFIDKREGIPCFREASAEARQALMDKDPKYGNVICRCETVTESEIVQAIHRQPGARIRTGLSAGSGPGLEDARLDSAACACRAYWPGNLASV